MMTKRTMAVSLAIALILSISFAIPTSAAAEEFHDYGFEDGTYSGWSAEGGTGVTAPLVVTTETDLSPATDTPQVFSGTYALRMSKADNYQVTYRQITGLEAGVTYEATVYVYLVTGAVRIYMAPGVWTSQSEQYAYNNFNSVGSWQHVKISYKIPSDGSVTSLYFGLKTEATGAIAYFDKISFCKQTTLSSNAGFEDIQSVTLNNSNNGTWAFDWTMQNSNNKVPSITSSTPNRAEVTSETAHTGSYSLKMQCITEAWGGRVYQTVSGLIGGKTYEFSAWVKTVGAITGGTRGAGIWVSNGSGDSASLFYNGSGTGRGGLMSKESYTTNTNGGWKKLTTFFTLPVNKTSTTLILTSASGYTAATYDGSQFYSYFDDINLIEASLAKAELFDANGEMLSSLSPSSDTAVTVKFSGVNADMENTKRYTYIAVVYEAFGGARRILTAEIVGQGEIPIAYNETFTNGSTEYTYAMPSFVKASASVTVPAGCCLSVFAWKDMSSLIPLIDSVSVSS